MDANYFQQTLLRWQTLFLYRAKMAMSQPIYFLRPQYFGPVNLKQFKNSFKISQFEGAWLNFVERMSLFGEITEAYKSHHIINDFLFPGSSKTAYGINFFHSKRLFPKLNVFDFGIQDGIHLSRTNSSACQLAELTISSFLACFFVGAVRDLRKTEKRSAINMLPLFWFTAMPTARTWEVYIHVHSGYARWWGFMFWFLSIRDMGSARAILAKTQSIALCLLPAPSPKTPFDGTLTTSWYMVGQ
jgi:hypothetical protein